MEASQLSFASKNAPKKKRKSRTAFTNHQIFELEKRFLYQKYLSPADRDEIAAALGLTNAQVITWFQNRRAKLKRDMEECRKDLACTPSLLPNVLAAAAGQQQQQLAAAMAHLANGAMANKALAFGIPALVSPRSSHDDDDQRGSPQIQVTDSDS